MRAAWTHEGAFLFFSIDYEDGGVDVEVWSRSSRGVFLAETVADFFTSKRMILSSSLCEGALDLRGS
jgi:hypothetical protein